MPGAIGATVQVAVGAGAAKLVAARRARDLATARCERLEDGVEMFNDLPLAADHQAVPALQAPDAAARAYVDVVDLLCAEVLRAADVVDVVRVAAVDDDVAGFELGQQVLD